MDTRVMAVLAFACWVGVGEGVSVAVVSTAVQTASQARTSSLKIDPESSLASIIRFTRATNPKFSRIFRQSRTPQFLLANFQKHAFKLSLFYPSDKALAKYHPKGACAKIPMSDILAQLSVTTMYSGEQLTRLKRGLKLRTLSPVYLTVLETKPQVKIGIVNGYQKIVSSATVTKVDALVNKRAFTLHEIDTVLTTC